MDKTDIAIVRALQGNARLTNLELAERVSLSPSPCLRRVKRLEEAGVITGYSAIIDQEKYGLPLTLFVRITLDRHQREVVEKFEAAVRGLDEVIECHLMTGSADYLLRVVMANLSDYERFMRDEIHEIRGVAAIDTSFSLVTVKQTRVFREP